MNYAFLERICYKGAYVLIVACLIPPNIVLYLTPESNRKRRKEMNTASPDFTATGVNLIK